MKKTYFWIISTIAAAILVFLILIPAFSGHLQINPVINLGFLQVHWYGVIITLAVLTGYFVARKNSWRFGVSADAIEDYAFWLVIVGVLGARLYYVLFNYNYFSSNIPEIYQIWHGGLSVYGGILAGLLFTYWYVKNKAFTFYQMFDLVALSMPLAQAVGRFGNFVNQEAYGTVTTLPWKMFIASDQQYHHPAFLYEAILNVFIFFILQKLVGKTKSGVIGWSYLAMYSFGRFFVEGIRVDSFFVNGFRVDQVVALLLFALSGTMILLKQNQVKNN